MKRLCLLFLITWQSFALGVTLSSHPPLSEEWKAQRETFHDQGFIWIKNFFSPEQVQLLLSWSEEIHCAGESLLTLSQKVPGTLIVVPEADNPLQVCRTEDMLTLYPDLHAFIAGTVATYLKHLLGEPYVLFKDKLNFKWPGGGAFSPHQDFPAFELLGPREHITAMVCIDPATIENGCLYIAENWRESFLEDPAVDQQQLQKGHAILPYIVGGKAHGSIEPEYVDKLSWLPLETSPGDLVLFTSFVPHYSEPNCSIHSRRAMFFTLNKLSEGDFRKAYYHAKREDPDNPIFHFGTPTQARSK